MPALQLRICFALALVASAAAAFEDGSNYRNQAYAFAQKKEWDQAIALYRKALALDPKNAELHFDAGLALKYKGDASAAIEEFSQAAALKPSWSDAHYALGAAYCDRGDTVNGSVQ